MIVREAKLDDARAIAVVHVRAWQDAYRGQMPDEYLDGLDVQQRAQGWTRTLTEPGDMTTFVVERDGAIVGIASVGPSLDTDPDKTDGELYMINVVKTAWGSGAGTALFARAGACLGERGFKGATLWVLDANARARRFYEREGWRLDGAERTDEERGFPLQEVRYRITLV